jgi:hypothetical protein
MVTTTSTTITQSTMGIVTANISWTYVNGITSIRMNINNLDTSKWFAMGLSRDDNMVKHSIRVDIDRELILI